MDSIKSRNKFLTCFRYVSVDDRSLTATKHRSVDQNFDYPAVGKNDGAASTVILPDLLSNNQAKAKGNRLLFSRILKSIWSEKSLSKKIRKSSKKKKLLKSKSDQMEKSNTANGLSRAELYEKSNVRTNSNMSISSCNSSLLTSTSLCSSCSSSLVSISTCSSGRNKSFRLNLISEKQANVEETGKGLYNSSIGGFMLLMSLFVLVLWGKVCAIVCTSTWLFFVPRWSGGYRAVNGVIMVPEIEMNMADHKKKVIMEGLLERNHSRGL